MCLVATFATALCAYNLMYIDTMYNSKPVKLFTKHLFEIWDSPVLPVDLSLLNNFEDAKCLISITNFINSETVQLQSPVVIRQPIPAVFKWDNASEALIGWVTENKINPFRKFNSSWIMKEGVSRTCWQFGQCEMFNLERMTIGSKLWNCELRVDLFPPGINASGLESEIEQLSGKYGRISYKTRRMFGMPVLWELEESKTLSDEVLVGRIPVLHFSMISNKHAKFLPKSDDVIGIWTKTKSIYGSANIQHFLIDLVANGNTYLPSRVRYINQQHSDEIVATKIVFNTKCNFQISG